jgi:hypothetical protein
MVIPIIEPVFAGLLVSLFNRFILSGQCSGWIAQSCERADIETEIIEAKEDEEEGVSSTTTSISDASVHVHYH